MVRLAVIASLGMTSAASAEIYRWVDENGRVHYGDQPPDQSAEALDVRPGSGPSPGERAARRQAEQAEQARALQCGRAQAQLQDYEQAVRLVERDADGNERELSAAERERLMQRAAADVATFCDDA